MDDDNKMENLYNRFKQELAETSKSTYYDEQDIVDIFDYAGDVHDDYIRFEALLLGYRLFPDSQDLLKRHAIYLADNSEEGFASFMATVQPLHVDVMWAILKCRSLMPRGNVAIQSLETILDTFTLEEDEETIQFVSLVKLLGQEQWIIDNLERVRSRCTYVPTLLFEVARIAESVQFYPSAIKILEELTMLDPFNADYWGLLAELQSSSEKLDDALTSLDYAKALLPDDYELLSLEGYIKLKQMKPEEAAPILEKTLSLNPDCYEAKRNLVEAYKQLNQISKAAPLLGELYGSDPSDVSLLMDVLYMLPDAIDQVLPKFYEATGDYDEGTTLQRIGELCINGQTLTALKYIQWYKQHYQLSQTGKFALLELLYINGRYDDAYEIIMDDCRKLTLEPTELPIVAIITSTLLRARDFESAKSFCDVWIERLEAIHVDQAGYRLVTRGLIDTLQDMRRFIAENPNPTDEQIDKVTV
jgi:tetratricopeptide (TPR) repeat protein